MFELFLALSLIIALYYRTFKYNNLIDDIVPIEDTMYSIPTSNPAPAYFLQKSPIGFRVRAIGIHMLNTILVYLILGSHTALLFSVFPICVNNVAWITGSFYSIATFFTLTAYYLLLHTPWFIGAPLGMAFFGMALNATLVTISFPFLFLFANPIGLCTLAPLYFFLVGKRFKTGMKTRTAFAKPRNLAPDVFTPGRLVACIKVVAYYLYLTLVPIKLVFFHTMGLRFLSDKKQREDLMAINLKFWASIALISSFLVVAFLLHKLFWAAWFLVLISAFSQYRILGQFFAERYMYPAIIGVVAILACLPDNLFWCLLGAYILRTFMFIPSFKSNRTLFETGTQFEPLEPANYCNLSDWHLLVEPDLGLAGYYAQETIKLDPADYKPHVNMSSLFMFLGQWSFALEESKTALKMMDGNTSEQFINIICAQIDRIQGNIDAAKSPAEQEAHTI